MSQSEAIDLAPLIRAELPGWRDLPNLPGLCRDMGAGWLVGGFAPDGRQYVKHTGLAPDGPETPDDPVLAARWLHAQYGGVAQEAPVQETPAPETDALWEPEPQQSPQQSQAELDAIAALEADFGAEDEPLSLGAELLEVQDEEGQDSGDDEQAAPIDLAPDGDSGGQWVDTDLAGSGGDFQPSSAAPEGAGVGSAYPGVAILPDDISVALALVIEAVASQEEARVAAVEDLQAADLQHQIDYGNWPAGTKIPDYIEAGAKRWQSLSQQRAAIQAHSLALRRSARDHRARGDLSALQGMADGVGDGWP